MKTVTRQSRSGFIGIGILLVLIVLVIIFAGLAKLIAANTSGGQQPGSSSQVSGTGQVLKDTSHISTALIHMGGQSGPDEPPDVAPIPDPAPVDPASGDGVDDILDGIFDGL
jgi:hypothetical protein